MDENKLIQLFKDMLKDELKPLKDDINGLKTDMIEVKADIKELKEGQQNILKLITELDPKNASKHVEINGKLDNIQNDVRFLKENLQKVEIVTGKNCIEIEYLKAVK